MSETGTEKDEIETSSVVQDTGGADAVPDDERPGDAVRVARSMGIERWVQFIWIAAAVILFGIYSAVVSLLWEIVEEPREMWVTIISAALAAGTAFFLYKHKEVNRFTREVIAELQKVTWPDREETWSQTVVVLVVSVVAAILLAVMDFAWGNVSSIVYNVDSPITDSADKGDDQ